MTTCRALLRVPPALLDAAVALVGNGATLCEARPLVECELDPHVQGDHAAHVVFVPDDPTGRAAWMFWQREPRLQLVDACTERDSAGDVCLLFAEHPAGHLWPDPDGSPRPAAAGRASVTEAGAGSERRRRDAAHRSEPLPPVCGATAVLPSSLVQQAVALAVPHGGAAAEEAERYLRCCLQSHGSDAHHAFVLELSGAETGAVWARWEAGAPSRFVVKVLPDCPATDQVTHEPCGEFVGHHGGHTYQLADPCPTHAKAPGAMPGAFGGRG